MKVGIFDSGVGGLTILKSLINKYPHNTYIYYGDTIHAPYGNKKIEEIVTYSKNIIKFLEDENVDLIIIACGTLSSNKEYLHSNKPLIDLLTPLDNKLDNYHKISIMATPLSIKTNAFKKYIHNNLNLIACDKLVDIIEKCEFNKLDEILQEYMKSTFDSDALLLGCTHYPIIKEYIAKYFNKRIITFDEYLKDLITEDINDKGSIKLYFSYIDDNVLKNINNILNKDVNIERKILDVRK